MGECSAFERTLEEIAWAGDSRRRAEFEGRAQDLA
jgi:hypothetical protein